MGVKWAWMGVGGRDNRSLGTAGYLEQIWHRGFSHSRECYTLYSHVMGILGGRVMGMDGLEMGVGGQFLPFFGNFDRANHWMDFNYIWHRFVTPTEILYSM